MAALVAVHWEAVTLQMRQILSSIGSASFSSRFYLAGGTALALQLGHRQSIDLDFFSETDEVLEKTRQEIIKHLTKSPLQILENTDGNLLLITENTRVGFFGYGYPLIRPVKVVEGVKLASLEDIGLMKLDAVISRGARKDFYDLFFIARETLLDDLFELAKVKFPMVRDFGMIALEHLVLFDNADRDIQPELLVSLPWDSIKQFFLQQAHLLAKKWFE
jgi:predicted nucleotidyltransferase component of viral defense system